jgi:hypothetical protein
MYRDDKCLVIKITAKLVKAFQKGAVAIRNRHVLEIMAVAVKPKVNSQTGRGASIFSPLLDNELRFPCGVLELPQASTKNRRIIIKEKEHSLRNGIHFPIFIVHIDELFNMK